MLIDVLVVLQFFLLQILIVLFQPLPGAGCDLLLFLVFGRGAWGSASLRPPFAAGALTTSAATGTPPAAATGVTVFPFIGLAIARGALGSLSHRRLIDIDVVQPREEVLALQIGVQIDLPIQIEIELRLSRLLAATTFARRRRGSLLTPGRSASLITSRLTAAFVAAAMLATRTTSRSSLIPAAAVSSPATAAVPVTAGAIIVPLPGTLFLFRRSRRCRFDLQIIVEVQRGDLGPRLDIVV
jgi:hypothetical protein